MSTFPGPAVRWPALLISAAALLSGPAAMLLLLWVAPQPAWTDARSFIEHYHSVQTLPYLLGFGLLIGFVLFVAACHQHASAGDRVRTTAGLVFTSVYASLVFANYMLQVAVVPRLMSSDPALVPILTMANPSSLAWFLEMFGYAALGVAMWLVAPLFEGTRRLDWIRWLLIANAVMSIAGAVFTALIDEWVFSTSGLVSFFAWNVVVIVSFALIAFGPRHATSYDTQYVARARLEEPGGRRTGG